MLLKILNYLVRFDSMANKDRLQLGTYHFDGRAIVIKLGNKISQDSKKISSSFQSGATT